MSAYAARLKKEMKPLLDELRELNDLEQPTAEQKADIDRITLELGGKKSEYDKAIERSKKATDAETMYGDLDDPAEQPRAQYDRPSRGAGSDKAEVKAVSSYLIDDREFKAQRGNQIKVLAPMPVGAMYPFMEQKAAYIPGNLNLAGPNLRVIEPAQLMQRFPLLALLRTVPWNEISVPYLPLVFTNNAAEVNIGAAKPESTNAGDIATLLMRTVAHWKEVPRQILRYIPRLRSTIDDELRWGVLFRMQNSVLNGAGTGGNMNGIINQVTQTAVGDSLIPQIFDAIGKVETAGGNVDAILINPTDYWTLVGSQAAADPFNPLIQGNTFYGYPVVKVAAQPAGTSLVGDFGQGVTLFVGEEANVQATEALGFKNNIVTIRAEMDAVVLVERPWLLCECPGPLVPVETP